MRPQKRQLRQHGVNHRGQRSEPPCQRRHNGQALDRTGPSRKESLQLLYSNTSHLGIARIVPAEVIPKKRSTSLKNPARLPGDARPQSVVQDRAEQGKTNDEIEKFVVKRQLRPVRLLKMKTGK